jgi:hypothetical protein
VPKLNRSQFKFRKNDRIGTEGAEEDDDYLFNCFLDTGDLAILRDTRDPRRIILGRTGAGKTALIRLLVQQESHVICIEPHELALQYLAGSTIIRHLEELGVNLDLFYRLLWRHVFAVELVRLKYHLHTESDQPSFFQRIRELFRTDKRKTDALDYLVEWGKKFWEDTETRVHEVTQKFEDDVRASLGAKAALVQASLDSGTAYSVEDRQEVVHRAQEVVNHVQIAKLSRIIQALAEDVFDDPQERFYVVVDRLDENWVSDTLRYRLIRALIETIKDLLTIRNAKIVVAIRRDLLDRVFRRTRDAGFQEEKYEALFLPLRWTKGQLLDLLDKRLNRLVQRQYSKGAVSWADLFPSTVDSTSSDDYIVCRTHYRPRDIIQFGNCCIEFATDRPDITASVVRDAEARYSSQRFRSLGDEWAADYPVLLDFANCLKKRAPEFLLSDITDKDLEALCLQTIDRQAVVGDRLYEWSSQLVDGHLSMDTYRRIIAKTFYEVGLVGIKPDAKRKTSWSFLDRDILREAEITTSARLQICPVFYRVLGTELR